MEYVYGSSLQQMVEGKARLDVERAVHYIRQAALGLSAVHMQGIVHRDIEPGNILVDHTGTVKIIDFGLSLAISDQLIPTNDNRLVTEGRLEPDYLAPECVLTSAADTRADIYSLGAVFYFCLADRHRAFRYGRQQKLLWLESSEPEPIRAVRPEVPEALATILERMMAKDPSARYPSMQAVADALAPWSNKSITPPAAHELPQWCPAAMELIRRSRRIDMTEPEIELPWYKRPILPPWMPGWLLACVLGGLGFGLALEFVVKPDWLGRAAIFGIGFLMVLISLTLAHAKTPAEQQVSGLYPPAWIRIPLIVVVVMFFIGTWVKDQIRGPAPPANLPRPEWALWLMAVCGGWLAFRFVWIGAKILLSLRTSGEPSGPMRALPMGLSALAGGAAGYATVVWLWPQAQHGWRQFFPWAAAVAGLVAGLVADMFLELRSGRWTSWLLSFRLPGYREQLHAPEPGARAAAAKALGGMQKHAVPALPDLFTALADESADVRAEAALAIYFISWYDANVPAEVTPHLRTAIRASGFPWRRHWPSPTRRWRPRS